MRSSWKSCADAKIVSRNGSIKTLNAAAAQVLRDHISSNSGHWLPNPVNLEGLLTALIVVQNLGLNGSPISGTVVSVFIPFVERWFGASHLFTTFFLVIVTKIRIS